MKQTFAVVQKPGPKWLEGKAIFDQPLLEHGRYMKSLHEQGLLLHGGPFLDSQGGLWIFQAEDEEQAQTIMAEDPALKEGIFTSELHEWMMVDWESYNP